jgi:hypothetical protein
MSLGTKVYTGNIYIFTKNATKISQVTLLRPLRGYLTRIEKMDAFWIQKWYLVPTNQVRKSQGIT